ncbi:protein kinase [Bdellovibrio sp.]|uniref:protein kinase n=1 Tax=Bdellovibrio sp. TaxID=28201 RepID=UPI002F3584F2
MILMICSLPFVVYAQTTCESVFSASETVEVATEEMDFTRQIWQTYEQPAQTNVTIEGPATSLGERLALSWKSLKGWSITDLFFNDKETRARLSEYHLAEALGRGFSGVVYRGILPSDGKTEVAVKVAKGGKTAQASLRFESSMSDKLSQADHENLFLRYNFDEKNQVLISSYEKDWIGMNSWLASQKSGVAPAGIAKIAMQLQKALQILKAANLVHSDLGLQNILINPQTLQIKIIDYGIMTEVGHYNPARANLRFNRRGGRFKSLNQQKDLPGQLADDEFAVIKIIEILQHRKNPLAFAGSLETRPAKNHEITALSPESSQWLYLTTRNGKISDKGYPVRMHDSMRLVFEPFVDDVLAGRERDFEEMLRTQHRIVAAGIDGNSKYWGSSIGFWNYIFLNKAVPGKFRNEVFNLGKLNFRLRLVISVDKTLDRDFKANTTGVTEFVKIAGVPADLLPSRKSSEDSVYYVYPPVDGIPTFLNLMEKNLLTALKLMREGEPRERVLPYLADYVQLGVSGHIFNLANYSIYMTQVNSILRRLGYEGISPANLDYHALVEDSEVFRQRFAREVERKH